MPIEHISPDRYAAEVVINKGGRALVAASGKAAVWVDSLDQLPESDFRTQETAFEQLSSVDDRCLDCLQDLSEIRAIFLWGTGTTDDGILRWRNMPKLRNVQLGWNPVGDKAMEHLAQFQSLETLSVLHTPPWGRGAEAPQQATESTWVIRLQHRTDRRGHEVLGGLRERGGR